MLCLRVDATECCSSQMPLSPTHREERDSFDYKKMTLDVLPNFLQLLPRITIQRAGTPWPQTMPPTNLRHHGCVEGNTYVVFKIEEGEM